MRNLVIILYAITLSSCFDENSYVITPVPIAEVKIPYSMYEHQTYYNLYDNQIVSHTNYVDWDLGFEASAEGYHIILNSSKFMYAGTTNQTDFKAVTSNVADTMIFDASSGNLDSTAIGNWVNYSDPLNPVYSKNVYIINRGVSEDGISFGFKKIVFEKLESNTYFIHYANLDNSDEHSFQVAKNSSVSFVQFSFDNGGNLNVQQPNKDLWDFNFTKYSTILFDKSNNNKPTPYLVRGVITNKDVLVAKDTVTPFGYINLASISSYTFISKQDAIGYDWKKYENDVYTILSHYSYIIKDRNNNYYKLRFTEFYNSIQGDANYGVKGYPSFELLKLDN